MGRLEALGDTADVSWADCEALRDAEDVPGLIRTVASQSRWSLAVWRL
jgi:hypothetical protein